MKKKSADCQVLFLDDSAILAEAVESTLSGRAGLVCMGLDCTDPALVAAQSGVASQVDIAVVDPTQSHLPPEELRRVLVERLGQHDTIAFLPDNAAAQARACLQAEYSGVVSRTRSLDSLAGAIDAVAGGGIYVDGCFGQFGEAASAGALPGVDGLSGREREVILAVARGDACKEIARELGISPKTVETHKYRAMDKLGLRDRSDVMGHARLNRWQG